MLREIKKQLLKLKYTLTLVVVTFFGLFGVFIVFTSSIPFNPIQHNLNFVKEVITYTPQGWAFFTRDARENQVYIYKVENNKLKKIDQNHADIVNFIGLSRKVSKLGMEAEIVSGFINKNKYPTTTWNYSENLFGKIPNRFIELKNPIKAPILQGEYVFVFHSVVPWAWSKSKHTIKMPAKVLKVRINV